MNEKAYSLLAMESKDIVRVFRRAMSLLTRLASSTRVMYGAPRVERVNEECSNDWTEYLPVMDSLCLLISGSRSKIALKLNLIPVLLIRFGRETEKLRLVHRPPIGTTSPQAGLVPFLSLCLKYSQVPEPLESGRDSTLASYPCVSH